MSNATAPDRMRARPHSLSPPCAVEASARRANPRASAPTAAANSSGVPKVAASKERALSANKTDAPSARQDMPAPPVPPASDVSALLSQLQAHHDKDAALVADLQNQSRKWKKRAETEREGRLQAYEDYADLKGTMEARVALLECENAKLGGDLEAAKKANSQAQLAMQISQCRIAANKEVHDRVRQERNALEAELLALRQGIEAREKHVADVEQRLETRRVVLLDALEMSRVALFEMSGSKKRALDNGDAERSAAKRQKGNTAKKASRKRVSGF